MRGMDEKRYIGVPITSELASLTEAQRLAVGDFIACALGVGIPATGLRDLFRELATCDLVAGETEVRRYG